MTTRRAAVIGGSVAGLASAIGLARRGWEVTVVERDLAPDTDDGDEAFLVWDRRNVPQFRQPHAFSARSRNLLLEHIPEVVDWLRADGIAEINLFKMLAPPELWSDEDDAYTGLWSRRPAFELAIRRIAEVEPGVTIVVPAIVRGLLDGRGLYPAARHRRRARRRHRASTPTSCSIVLAADRRSRSGSPRKASRFPSRSRTATPCTTPATTG